MTNRILALGAALAVAAFVGTAVAADKPADSNTHTGVVVSVADGKLTMTDKDGKNEHSHTVAKDAKITCDGKDCKLDDLKKGQTVTVTVEKQGDDTRSPRGSRRRPPRTRTRERQVTSRPRADLSRRAPVDDGAARPRFHRPRERPPTLRRQATAIRRRGMAFAEEQNWPRGEVASPADRLYSIPCSHYSTARWRRPWPMLAPPSCPIAD